MNQFITSAIYISLALVTVLCRTVLGDPVHANKGYPRYAFKHDLTTKDNIAHWARRDDDVVKSSYSLLEPDGATRVVDYRSGFNAIKRINSNLHPIPFLLAVPNYLNNNANGIEQESLISPLANLALLNPPANINYGFGPAMTAYSRDVAKSATVGFIPAPTLFDLPKTITIGEWSHVPSGITETSFREKWSLPWDPTTGSYGGWVPMRRGNIVKHHPETYATVITKKTVNGKLHKVITGPITLSGRTLLIKNKVYHE